MPCVSPRNEEQEESNYGRHAGEHSQYTATSIFHFLKSTGYVPCADCDEKITLKGLAQHVVEKHCNGVEFKAKNYGDTKHLGTKMGFKRPVVRCLSVTGDDPHKFLFNWCP